MCRKSCLATTQRDAELLFTLHPLTSHVPTTPFSFPLLLRCRDEVAWMDGLWRQHSLWLSGEFGQQILNKLREGGKRERRVGGGSVGE